MRTISTFAVAIVLFAVAPTSQLASAVPFTAGRGPGGVGTTNGTSNLRLWLDASDINNDNGVTNPADGASITTWRDKSGYTQNATIVAGTPIYDSVGVGLPNDLPFIDFDATAHLRVSNFVTNVLANKAFTAFVVMTDSIGISNSRTGTVPRFYLQPSSFSYNEPNMTVGPWTDPTGYNVHSYQHNGTSIFGWIDGSLQGSTVKALANISGSLEVPFNGTNKIAEIVIHDTSLNSAHRILTENYLSSKYTTTPLAANDFYAGDTNANGDHDFNVFGVGRVDGSNQWTNAGAAGFGIEVTGGLGDDEWVLAGHNMPTNTILPTVEGSFSDGERWARTWYVDATGAMNVTLGFDFSDAGVSGGFVPTDEFTLLYSSSLDFDWTMVNATASLSGDLVTFSLPNFDQDGFYTLGINVVPLPVAEPSSCALLATAALGAIAIGRRRRKCLA